MKQLIADFGSHQFEARLSHEKMSEIFNVIIMRKFEPLRDVVIKNVLRIFEGRLLAIAAYINFIPQNGNPHRYKC